MAPDSNMTTASLRYLENTDDLAVYIATRGGDSAAVHEGNYVDVTVPIHNARELATAWRLDEHGFKLANQLTAVTDFYDEKQIEEIYQSEICQLVQQQTGSSHVEIFDHTRRSSSEQLRKQRKIRESASVIHNDYTADSGKRRLDDFIEQHSEAHIRELASQRFAIINVWRTIAGVVESFPLAMCDASSTKPEDLVAVKRQARDRIGEIQLAAFSPAHRWYFFPAMLPTEALLFKTFDSVDDGRARFTIHSSFDDVAAGPDAAPRESMETRCFVFFDELT